MNRLSLILSILALMILGLLGSVYVVREGQLGLVLNLGRVARSEIGPGLHFKIPLIETAHVFDRRFQASEFPPERSLTSERKDVSVDFVAIAHITNVADFYRATGGNEAIAVDRLAPIIKESLRNEINARTLTQLVSGDRAELISIARALLKNAPIIILDEPTAALDSESECMVQTAIDALVAEKTVLVIAHRLSTIAGADQIIVLDEGHIAQTGTHATLLAQPGRYRAMWDAQQRTKQWHVR